MTVQARFIQDGMAIDHTPSTAVAVGDVVVIGTDLVTIARHAIAASELGSVYTCGVYDVVKDNSDISEGDPLYWDDDGDPVGGDSGTGAFSAIGSLGPFAGWALADAGVGAGTVRLQLVSLDSQAAVNRSELVQEDLVPYAIPMTSLRVHDAMATNLPASAANDDMGLVTGTPGTNAPYVAGVDFGGTTSDEKGSFEFTLPPEYTAGQSITVRARAGMLTTVADTSATVDVQCWKSNGDGAVGSDLCATAAQAINSLTLANKDFTITPTGLAAGDRLIIRLAFAGTDSGNAGVMIPAITELSMLLDIKG